MTKRIRFLLVISLLLLLVAFGMKRVHLSEKGAMIVGIVEVLSAIVLGIAFGLAGRTRAKTDN